MEIHTVKDTDYVFDEYARSDQFPNMFGFGFVRSKHISIFDKHEGNTSKNASSRGGLSEPELLFAQHLAQTYLARKESIPLIANEYPLCNLGAYADFTQRFDYALINESLKALVLVIELDGIHHRYNPDYDKLQTVKERDAKKNSFCIEKQGAILTSLKREDVEAHLETFLSFTLLRLPVDGTSQCELSSLSSERSADFFTIDELYDRQLELITSKGVAPVSAIIGENITTLIKNRPDVNKSPEKLNKVLKEKGLIVKDRPTLLKSAPTECWRVDKDNKGSKCGAYNTLRIDMDKRYAYWVPRFNSNNEEFLRHLYDKKDEV